MRERTVLLGVLALVVVTATGAVAAAAPKVQICHLPPGNPDNGHVIEVASAAEPAHLAHGDCAATAGSVIGESCECIAVFPISVVAEPDAFFIDTPTLVRVQARVPPDPELDPSGVFLLRLSDGLVEVPVCNLLDNGDLGNGDDIAGDSVFSCFSPFDEPQPVSILLRVDAAVGAGIISSGIFALEVVAPLSDEDAQTAVAVQQAAADIWAEKLAELGDTLEARLETAALIRELPGVADAGVSPDDVTIWIDYTSGLTGGLMLNPPGTRGGTGDRGDAAAASATDTAPARFGPVVNQQVEENIEVGNNRVLVWDAYNSEFAPFDEGPAIRDLFQNSECPKYTVTYLIDEECTVASVNTFTQYGTIVMVTHGAVDKDGNVVFLTRSEADFLGILANSINLILGRLTIMGDVFAVRPSFISSRSGSFEDAIIYNGSCQSSANSTMADAFTGKGAKTYLGFTRVVNSDFAEDVATELFTSLVEDLATTQEAFDPITPKTDPTPPNAVFTLQGAGNVLYTGRLQNGSFEKGVLGAWTRAGDGRVIVTLGPTTPTDGSFMGIISTGLGFTTASGSISQDFCLPADATELKFDWQFFSEEFVEWCGSQWPFDDPFVVELITESGTEELFRENVDTLCNSVSATGLFFDQSGPGCEPTPGVGVGTGGNDCTVWSTGWRNEAIDVSAVATANDGKGVTLRFRNFDAGDSIFDSAVTLDKIEVVQP